MSRSGTPRLPGRRAVVAHLVAAQFVLLLGIWLSTGTMAPYAATQDFPTVLEPCHYLVNVDHAQFEATFSMLEGKDPAMWSWSVVLRRVLYPLIAYPFMKLFGYMAGGIVAGVLVSCCSVAAFVLFVRNEIGNRGAIAVAWLLATYPGITYWAGLPYSNVMIVPGSLLSLMLMYRIARATTLRDVAVDSLLLGTIFLGYDLFPLFGPAVAMMLFFGRRFVQAAVSTVLMLVPTALVGIVFVAVDIPVMNSNTGIYGVVLTSYLHPAAGWLRVIASLPIVFSAVFFLSNFVFIPALFVVILLAWKRGTVRLFAAPELALLATAALLFVFNNAAPDYYGWQMRGAWISRIYQPVVGAFLVVAARVVELDRRPRWSVCVAVTAVLNFSVVLGALTMNPLASRIYHGFYGHGKPDALITNMTRFGRRPLGFCSNSHALDEYMRVQSAAWRLPDYAYRTGKGPE